MTKPPPDIKRVYRNQQGWLIAIRVTAKTVYIYAPSPGCELSTEQFAAILTDIQDAWQVLNQGRTS
jgi:hypothetical protein